MIRNTCADDAPALAAIYNHYILHSPATFEEEVLHAEHMCERVAAVKSQGLPWLVALDGAELVGYAYASLWRERSAFRFSVESTVYLAPQRIGDQQFARSRQITAGAWAQKEKQRDAG